MTNQIFKFLIFFHCQTSLFRSNVDNLLSINNHKCSWFGWLKNNWSIYIYIYIYIYIFTICQSEGDVVVDALSKRKWIMSSSWLGVGWWMRKKKNCYKLIFSCILFLHCHKGKIPKRVKWIPNLCIKKWTIILWFWVHSQLGYQKKGKRIPQFS
jgi:hypothetical protein